MGAIARAVLSEHLQERIAGRRVIAAVFLTYQFDPGFFEQEVLPVVLDVPVSHAVPIRLVQLEVALVQVPDGIAVYFDGNGLVTGDAGSAKLDVRRIPVRHRAIFHPKNVFVLVEAAEPDADGHRARALIVTAMSANLTRSGWWENVECCHAEELPEGSHTRTRDELVWFLERLRRQAPAEEEHRALNAILSFARATTQRAHRRIDDRMLPHFYGGRASLVDFLADCAGSDLNGAYLEVISPYFDADDDCGPLRAMIERFAPREVRVALPVSRAGNGLCREALYDAVSELPAVHWGRLPGDLLRLGSHADAGERFVHAKAYRFFRQHPKQEWIFVGSPNLTTAGHETRGNVESGWFVQTTPARRPEWWLATDERRPPMFESRTEDDTARSGGSRFCIRYSWDAATAEVRWDGSKDSPVVTVDSLRGMDLGPIGPIQPGVWQPLPSAFAARLRDVLAESSFLRVTGENEVPGLLLVQEEGMSHKPSLLMTLSAADILRYWALLTADQRAAFLEARAPELALDGQGADLVARVRALHADDTLFDRFAGFFHAFACLERTVHDALLADRQTEAVYRLFGCKYDSLGTLLDRVLDDKSGDDVDRYVLVSCARQLLRELKKDHAAFFADHADDDRALRTRLDATTPLRDRLVATDPKAMPDFLDWFDKWFQRRAQALSEAS